MVTSIEDFSEGFEYGMGVFNGILECRCASAGAVAPIVGYTEVDALSIVGRSDVVIVAGDFSVAVEEEDGGRALTLNIEAAGNRYTLLHWDEMVG